METLQNPINFKTSFDGVYEATGILNTEGFLFYHVGCLFIFTDPLQPTLRLHADGFGDDFDFSLSDLEGFFSKPAKELEGKCRFSLLGLDEDVGGFELCIYKDADIVGRFTGEAEGMGEVAIKDHEAKLTIPKPKEHVNLFTFKGSSGITSINFYYGDNNSVTPGQPWGEVDSESKDHGKSVVVKVDSGRKADKKNAAWFNATVDSSSSKMFHTRGGDNVPSELNFAIKGILEINEARFEVCLGQGTSGAYNNWHLASLSIHSPHPHKGGTMGEYEFEQSGSSEFIVKLKK